jgi:hypothetical protein
MIHVEFSIFYVWCWTDLLQCGIYNQIWIRFKLKRQLDFDLLIFFHSPLYLGKLVEFIWRIKVAGQEYGFVEMWNSLTQYSPLKQIKLKNSLYFHLSKQRSNKSRKLKSSCPPTLFNIHSYFNKTFQIKYATEFSTFFIRWFCG